MPNWFLWISLASIFAMAISWLTFGRFTMSRIEREIKAEGLPRPCPWDGPGARILWYAYAIAIPIGRFNRADDPTINAPLVRSYTKPADKFWGWALIVFGNVLAVLAVSGWLVWGQK